MASDSDQAVRRQALLGISFLSKIFHLYSSFALQLGIADVYIF